MVIIFIFEIIKKKKKKRETSSNCKNEIFITKTRQKHKNIYQVLLKSAQQVGVYNAEHTYT